MKGNLLLVTLALACGLAEAVVPNPAMVEAATMMVSK